MYCIHNIDARVSNNIARAGAGKPLRYIRMWPWACPALPRGGPAAAYVALVPG
ncbi:hypothetical protein JYU34_004523 [Plutella xylostella]|uniref:Uncharacterized protein n=1 Tax=Plutella xylostella TaxID=51655 RepID=A0ABQ7QY76_PLUXY|nr:hypothetical protein JYU34_004523 [Plutella xylostella]